MRQHFTLQNGYKQKDNKDVQKLEPSYIVGGNVKWCRYFGKESGSSSTDKTQSSYMTHQFYSEAYIRPREMKTCPHKRPYLEVHSAVFIRAKSGNSPNVHQLMNGYIKWDRSIQWTIYYSAIKRNEVPIHGTSQMKLKNMMLSM